MGYTGVSKVLQTGIEGVAYGTEAAAYTNQLNYISESMEYSVEKNEEESLGEAKVSSGFNIGNKRASGSLDLIVKPEDIGFVFKHTLGTEAGNPTLLGGTTGVYVHTFVPDDDNVSSFSTIIDRGEDIKVYTGCKIDELSIDCKPGDAMRASLSIKAQDEGSSGTLNAGLTPDVLKSFNFDSGSMTIDATPYASISSLTFKYSNQMDDGEVYLFAGGFAGEPLPKTRSITFDFEAEYDTVTEGLREGSYKTGTKFATVLTFVSPSLVETGQNYKIILTMPNCELTEAKANVSGRDKIKFTGTAVALQVGVTEALTVTLNDATSTKY